MTRQKAIDNYCKWCIYDPLDKGTWKQQVEACDFTECPLYNYRPKSRSNIDFKLDSARTPPAQSA